MRRACLAGFAQLFALASSATAQAPPSAPRPFAPDDALQIASYNPVDLSSDGRWLVATSSTRRDLLGNDYRRDGDPSYIRPASMRLWAIDTRSGQAIAIFPEPANVRAAAWSPDASRLAVLVLRNAAIELVVWDRQTTRMRSLPVPSGRYIAENSEVRWTHDGTRLVVSLRSDAWRSRVTTQFEQMTKGPIFVQDGADPFLTWDDLRRQGNVRTIATMDATSGQVRELLPESMVGQFNLSADDSILTYQADITKKTDYDVIFGADYRLAARRLASGETTEIFPNLKGVSLQWAEDGRTYAYAKDGRVFLASIGRTARQLAGPDSAKKEDPSDTTAASREKRATERFSLVRVAPAGDAVLISNPKGFWVVDAATNARDMVVETGDSLSTAPRYTPAAWSTDGRYIYFGVSGRPRWERGFVRYDRSSKTLETLVKDARIYSGLRLSKDGSTAIYAMGDGNRPSDWFAAGPDLTQGRRLTDANPQLRTLALASTQLITYLDADGRTRYGVVYLPPNYSRSTRYPTLFNIYEDFYDDAFDATVNVLTANGYVVVKPSVGFEIGYPGEAWAKGVTAAANALVTAGIADSSRLGVFGTSYGGYATNLLITQTNRFKAAVNISGKVDVISFYTDSPRLGVRNVHAAEKSQDRLGATLWQQPQKYIAQSAIFFADRITTPLMLVTGQQDPNVPADNTREMFYALRRLGKQVTWVDYMNSGHGTPGTNAAEFIDFHNRLLRFFGKHLKGEAAGRAVEGVSLLGDSLYRAVPAGTARGSMEQQLAAARAAWEHTPDNADSLIWYGRRTAYLGRFNDAIAIYTDGIARHPEDARIFRHRGHRYLSVRRIDDAIADFERAAALTRGKPDEVEPDGQPNARNIPTSTLQSNIWYHLGLAYYLKGYFTNALRAYREDLKRATNADMQVATSHWLYMTLRRMGRTDEAARVLQPINNSMEIIENGAYYKLLLMYKGEVTPESLLAANAAGGLDDVTTAYGVANWYLYNGRAADAEALFRRVVGQNAQWAAFGYLACEAELKRMQGPVSAPATGAAARQR
ncbi:MAG: prolyl oligopeptidase family serine peptidase [Gemmatimonadaceae bacterium]